MIDQLVVVEPPMGLVLLATLGALALLRVVAIFALWWSRLAGMPWSTRRDAGGFLYWTHTFTEQKADALVAWLACTPKVEDMSDEERARFAMGSLTIVAGMTRLPGAVLKFTRGVRMTIDQERREVRVDFIVRKRGET